MNKKKIVTTTYKRTYIHYVFNNETWVSGCSVSKRYLKQVTLTLKISPNFWDFPQNCDREPIVVEGKKLPKCFKKLIDYQSNKTCFVHFAF